MPPITPESFSSDTPPPRIIGTECEYSIQNINPAGNTVPLNVYINSAATGRVGLKRFESFLGNGARLYVDIDKFLEYATPECLGPLEAATYDMSGISLLSDIVEASGVPHRGLHRFTGTIFGPTIDRGGVTNGYHENYLIPRTITESPQLAELLPTFFATQLHSMSGTVQGTYMLSQKALGIGGIPITSDYGRRTTHKEKPMIFSPPVDSDKDVFVAPEWTRIERRYADAGLSPDARYLTLAATSLVLRLIEHRTLISRRLRSHMLESPTIAAREIASDLTLARKFQVRNGRRRTALDIQEAFAEAVMSMAERIELPSDEVQAAHIWVETNDALRRSNPSKGEYDEAALCLDFVARHLYLLQRLSLPEINYKNSEAIQLNVEWDKILPQGIGLQWWRYKKPRFVSPQQVDTARLSPPPTRAMARARVINNYRGKIKSVTWASVKLNNGRSVILGNSYETRTRAT